MLHLLLFHLFAHVEPLIVGKLIAQVNFTEASRRRFHSYN